MPDKEFIQEHKKLVPILEHGNEKEREEEGKKQGKELEEMKKGISNKYKK